MPSRWPAALVTLVAVASLSFPIWYTARVAASFGPFGTLIAWTCVSVAIFAILTVVVSVWKSRLVPAAPQEPTEPQGLWESIHGEGRRRLK
ncbi:MAG: hypothetical protein HYT80_08800 [Euryarchaeota archaeon]|nr:hypothetical protein [Euryarchaeota archaeon]